MEEAGVAVEVEAVVAVAQAPAALVVAQALVALDPPVVEVVGQDGALQG